jgi:hypothetical protein
MTAPATPPDAEVQWWLARDPAHPCRQSAAAWARFGVIRSRLLRHLRRDPCMWQLQGRNILRGLARLGMLGLAPAPPVLAFWEPGRWPVVLGVGYLGLLLVDRLLGQRLSRFRNVFVDQAERLAWVVVALETPEEPPAARSHPGSRA